VCILHDELKYKTLELARRIVAEIELRSTYTSTHSWIRRCCCY